MTSPADYAENPWYSKRSGVFSDALHFEEVLFKTRIPYFNFDINLIHIKTTEISSKCRNSSHTKRLIATKKIKV